MKTLALFILALALPVSAQAQWQSPPIVDYDRHISQDALSQDRSITVFRQDGGVDIGSYNRDSYILFPDKGGVEYGQIDRRGDITVFGADDD